MIHRYQEGQYDHYGLNVGWRQGPVVSLRWRFGCRNHRLFARLRWGREGRGCYVRWEAWEPYAWKSYPEGGQPITSKFWQIF